MSRLDLFEAIRPYAPDKRFTPQMVAAIDGLADAFGLPRIETSQPWLEKALKLIKEFEGCRLTAYPDPGSGGDPWTIGWGSTGPGIKKGVTWTQDMADARLSSDVTKFAAKVDALLGAAPTTPGQKAALVSLAYNIGTGNLQTSTLLRLHKEGDYVAAQGQFQRWNKAAGKVLPGLTRRRMAEAEVYAS